MKATSRSVENRLVQQFLAPAPGSRGRRERLLRGGPGIPFETASSVFGNSGVTPLAQEQANSRLHQALPVA